MRALEDILADLKLAHDRSDLTALRSLADELRDVGTPEAEAAEQGARGRVHMIHGDLDAALDCYRRVLELKTEFGAPVDIAGSTANLGCVYQEKGDHPAALEYLHRARVLYEELGDTRGLAVLSCNIATVHFDTCAYAEALEGFQHALDVHENLGDVRSKALIHSNIGNVHLAMEDFTAALEHYQHAQAMCEDLGDRVGVSMAIGDIGAVHHRLGDGAAALAAYQQARDLHRTLGMKEHSLRAACDVCLTLLEMGRIDEVRVTLEEIANEEANSVGVRVDRGLLRARVREHDGDARGAREDCLLALEEAERGASPVCIADAHKALRDLAERQNDLPRYIEHNNAYVEVAEQIRGAEARLQIAMQQKQREIDRIERDHERARAVLYSTLPKHIADRVLGGDDVSGDYYETSAVLFLDIVGFTALSAAISPRQVVRLLDTTFRAFDEVVDRHDVVKVKTIGDAYLAVAFPSEEAGGASPAQRIAAAALDLVDAAATLRGDAAEGDAGGGEDDALPPIRVRIGIHEGPVVAGVIGSDRLQYDVWGDTVNTASRMESAGEPGRIHASDAIVASLRDVPHPAADESDAPLVTRRSWRVVERGILDVKGKGPTRTHWLER